MLGVETIESGHPRVHTYLPTILCQEELERKEGIMKVMEAASEGEEVEEG